MRQWWYPNRDYICDVTENGSIFLIFSIAQRLRRFRWTPKCAPQNTDTFVAYQCYLRTHHSQWHITCVYRTPKVAVGREVCFTRMLQFYGNITHRSQLVSIRALHVSRSISGMWQINWSVFPEDFVWKPNPFLKKQRLYNLREGDLVLECCLARCLGSDLHCGGHYRPVPLGLPYVANLLQVDSNTCPYLQHYNMTFRSTFLERAHELRINCCIPIISFCISYIYQLLYFPLFSSP
jgi:hypothetical protein